MRFGEGFVEEIKDNGLAKVRVSCDSLYVACSVCAAADHVVHAHCHAVDTHGVVFIHKEGDFQFCAHAVGTAHQHGMFHAFYVRIE